MNDMFDFFAGSSAGSTIVSGLVYPSDTDATLPKYSLDDLIATVKKQSKELFQLMPGMSAGEIIVWILFFLFWMVLFYILGRYLYDWPYE